MAVSLYQIAVDAHDLKGQAAFWARVLGWRVLHEALDAVAIGADEGTLPGIVFLPVPEVKSRKNRLHLDLTPDGDQAAEVERLLALGARHADVGQDPDASWVVLADPEGNEFCVLTPKRTLVDQD